MQVETVPITDFIHGTLTMREGQPQLLEAGLADELERAGLVRINITPNQRGAPGKAVAVGAVPPSSASPAAIASPTRTLPLSGRGHGRTPQDAA